MMWREIHCSKLWFLGKNAEKRCHFLCEEILIISVGLGNCGKGAGNWSFEIPWIIHSKEWLNFFFLICPALFHCPSVHGMGGKGWKYATSSMRFCNKVPGAFGVSIKVKGKNEIVKRWLLAVNSCNFCSSVGNLVCFHVLIDFLSSAS